MLNKHTLWLTQLNKAIDAKELQPDTDKTLKVTRELYEFIMWKFKTNTFRGYTILCK